MNKKIYICMCLLFLCFSATAADMRCPGPAGDQVSHPLLPDMFVPVSEEQQNETDIFERKMAKKWSSENEENRNVLLQCLFKVTALFPAENSKPAKLYC